MNKKQPLLDWVTTLYLLACIIVLWFGEAIRDVAYAKVDIAFVSDALLCWLPIDVNAHPKWLLYSGLFIVLTQKLR